MKESDKSADVYRSIDLEFHDNDKKRYCHDNDDRNHRKSRAVINMILTMRNLSETEIIKIPPGLSTRATSAKAVEKSDKICSTYRAVTASTLLSGTGMLSKVPSMI